MKKYWKLNSFILLTLLVISVFAIIHSTNNNEGFTTADLIQNRIEKKKGIYTSSNPKFDQPSEYVNYHLGIRIKEGDLQSLYPANYKQKELKKALYLMSRNARTASLEFIERGPVNTPGRSRSLIISPEDENHQTWVLGTVGGGIWKTTDAGETWTNTTKDLPSLAVTSLDYAKTNPDIIYAGTGEAVGGSVGLLGSGVFKSIDGGDTWSQLPSTTSKEFSVINRLVVSPTDPQTVILCTSQADNWDRIFRSNIYKTIDGGDTWSEVYESDSWVSQIIFNPENPNTLFGGLWGQGILKSTDGGNTWSKKLDGFFSATGRVELAIAPTDTSWIYASTVGNARNVNYDLYLSTNAGESWVVVDQKYNNTRLDFLGGQGDYDNTIAVHPFNKRIAYIGGVDLWKTEVLDNQSFQDVDNVEVTVANGEESFWEFVNFGGEFFDGKLDDGESFISEFNSVRLVTGPGISQFAHRFTVNKQGSGVPDLNYKYQDYVEVPFQVWDIDNNRQLMVSFRDQQEDGEFSLFNQNSAEGDEANHSREYIYIHKAVYAESPNTNIAKDGGKNAGHVFQQMYFFWPVLKDGKSFDNDNPEQDTINIDYSVASMELRGSNHLNVSDAYDNYDEKNNAYDIDAGQFILHPDHHFLNIIPINIQDSTFKIFDCNDGGIYISNISKNPGFNDGDWTSAGIGVVSGQFYGADKKPNEDIYIGGMQDNGTWKSPEQEIASNSTTYNLSLTGDGFEALWHNIDPDLIIGSSQNNGFAKSSDGGTTWFVATNGITGTSPFISKLSNSPSKPDILFTVTSDGVFKSTNFGSNWQLTSITEKWGLTAFLDVDVSRTNYNIIWAGSGMGSTQNLHVSTDGGNSFTLTNNYNQAILGNISGLYAHPIEDSTAYALFSFSEGPKILRTEDLGQTWEDISGFGSGSVSTNGFPDVAVYDLLVRPDDPNILWAGTEIGIFESNNNGETWTFLDSELGSAAIWQLKPVEDQIVISTHGRGIWTAMLDDFVEVTFTPEIITGGTTINEELFLRVDFNSVYDSTNFYSGSTLFHQLSSTNISKDSLIIIENPGLVLNEVHNIEMISYKNGKPFSSEIQEVVYYGINDPALEYVNNFDDQDASDLIGIGFSLDRPDGFNNHAIHSTHPYPEGIQYPRATYELTYYLKSPIVIGEKNTRFQYRDIAIVETGEIGSKYGEEDFYDYVVIEASKNGYEWINIQEGYDANKQSSWKTAYDNGSDGNSNMYFSHDILLNEDFNTGDELLFRFRLYTDPYSSGWGWAVDDLSIREVPITGLDNIINENIVLFPNPSQGTINIKLDVTNQSEYTFALLDINGKPVQKELVYSLSVGKNEIVFNRGNLLPGVYLLRISDLNSQNHILKKVIFK